MVRMNNEENIQHKPKTNGVVKMIGLGMVILILSSGLYYFLSYNDEIEEGDPLIPAERTLGERLDDAGWSLYTMTGCGWCEEQKKVLGNDIYGLKIENCNNREECTKIVQEQDIKGFPTWINVYSNEISPGFKTIEELEEMTK